MLSRMLREMDAKGPVETRVALRRFFEVERNYVAVAALKALTEGSAVEPSVAVSVIARYGVETETGPPWMR